MKKGLWGLIFCAVLAGEALAIEPFEIRDIQVDGLQRISAGTVFNYLPVSVGDTLTGSQSEAAIRALFQTGFFEDVRLERRDDVLVVAVAERPIIATVDVEGNKEIGDEMLTEALDSIGLAKGQVFRRDLLGQVERELQQQYMSRGRYAVKIESRVTPLPRNRVAIQLDVDEGAVATIRSINLIGNDVFSEEDLLDLFQLKTTGWFSFYTKSDRYSRQQLSADLERLRSHYLDRGYLDFGVDSTQVSITPDRRAIYITINVTEGPRYTVSGVELAGNLVVPEEELQPLVGVTAGDTFSRRETTETATRISERLSDEGYAFANVNMVPQVDRENQEVALQFFVDPGRRIYINRIEFSGNERTRDEVLRREMRQMEGALFSAEKIERSRTRLNRLGFFQDVTVETPPVPGEPDQVDVDYSVVERPSGSLMAGAGFSQSQGIILNASLSQDNFMGTGKRVSVSFNNSDVNTLYSLSYSNPYYTMDGVSRSFRLYFRETDAEEANIAVYTADSAGGSVTYGWPLTENDVFRFGLGYESTTINATRNSSDEVLEFIENEDSFNTYRTTLTWIHDTRDRALFPHRGTKTSASAEIAVPGSTWQFYRVKLNSAWYFPVTDSVTLSMEGRVNYGSGYGDESNLPLTENFYGGGPYSVRGYRANTLGPRDSRDRPLGGDLSTSATMELLFPMPGAADNDSVRLGAFVDAGNVYETDRDTVDLGELRYSTGVSINWLSPLGALTFIFAQPFNDQPNDDTQVFQFQLGTTY